MSTPNNSQPARLINGGNHAKGYKVRFNKIFVDSDLILNLISKFGDNIYSLTAVYNDNTKYFSIWNASDLNALVPADYLDIAFTANSHPGEIIQWIKKTYPNIVETLLLTTDYKTKSYVIGSEDFSNAKLNRVDLRCLAAPSKFSFIDNLFSLRRPFFDYPESIWPITLNDCNERISKTIARLHCFNPDISQCHFDKYMDDSYFKNNGYELLATDFREIKTSETNKDLFIFRIDEFIDNIGWYFFSFTCTEGSFKHKFAVVPVYCRVWQTSDLYKLYIIYYHKVEPI